MRTTLAAVRLGALVICLGFVGAVQRPAPGGGQWTAPQIASLHSAIDDALKTPALRGAHIGLVARDTVRGTVLYARNRDDEFIPASNFKLLVGSAALEELGTNFVFTTSVLADVPPQNGTIDGNIYLRGGGDALLSAADLDAAAAQIAAAGVSRITGSLITDVAHDDRQRWGFGWSWDDLPYAYAPVVSALELEDGVVHVTVSPGSKIGEPAVLQINPQSVAYRIVNRVVTGSARSEDRVDIVRPWDAPTTVEIVGQYPLGAPASDDIAPSVPDPESYAGDVFSHALTAHGVLVAGDVHDGTLPGGARTIWSHVSDTMPKLLADCWLPSDNLVAELLLKELGVSAGGEPGSDAAGRRVEERYLQSIGIDAHTLTIADGSGLSSYDRVTPDDLVVILQHDWNAPYRDAVIDALPLAGVRGTLREQFVGTAAENTVFAKTGSMNHVRTISGYVQTKTHGPVTFSFLINGWMGERQPSGEQQLAAVRAAILSAIAEQ